MVDPLTAGAAVLTGIKLVKQSVDFVKTQIQTCNDIKLSKIEIKKILTISQLKMLLGKL